MALAEKGQNGALRRFNVHCTIAKQPANEPNERLCDQSENCQMC